MRSRARTLLAATVLCLLAVWGYGAQSASASGLTGVECVEVAEGTGEYSTSQCTTPKEGGSNWETKLLPQNEKLEAEGIATRTKTAEEGGGHGLGSTEKPVAVFHTTVAGILVTITCGGTQAFGGKFENKTVGEEMQIHLVESQAIYTECHIAPEANPTKICNVIGTSPATAENELKTNKTTGISGPNHKVTIKPEGETPFLEFKILKKSEKAPNCFTASDLPIKVTGEATGEANTTTHSHLTIQEPWPCGAAEQPACGKLKANNAKAAQTVTGTAFTKGTGIVLGAETF